jgi:hypothetical protein
VGENPEIERKAKITDPNHVLVLVQICLFMKMGKKIDLFDDSFSNVSGIILSIPLKVPKHEIFDGVFLHISGLTRP